MRPNFINAAARLQSFGVGIAARLTRRVITSDKVVLCKPCGLILLGFFDTLHTPRKTLGNTPLQAGQLAVLEEGRCPLFLPLMTVSTPT